MRLSRIVLLSGTLVFASGLLLARPSSPPVDAAETSAARSALAAARAQEEKARGRAERLQQAAQRSRNSIARAEEDAIALGARIQEGEARLATLAAERRVLAEQRRAAEMELARQRQPLAELTGALQSALRRPIAFALLQPGSLKDTVYLGATLDATVPLIQTRTRGVRGRLDRIAALDSRIQASLAQARETEGRLTRERLTLEATAERERIAARRAGGAAVREERRALALAEQARDLDSLVGQMNAMGDLRRRLAALPGPSLRPVDPQRAQRPEVTNGASQPEERSRSINYRLPVDGRVRSGFARNREGIELAAPQNGVVIAPARGRIAFAGPFRGFANIVILEHPDGWTSLVTGLAQVTVRVGQDVAQGVPLGTAPAGSPAIGLELRRDGMPVNPFDAL